MRSTLWNTFFSFSLHSLFQYDIWLKCLLNLKMRQRIETEMRVTTLTKGMRRKNEAGPKRLKVKRYLAPQQCQWQFYSFSAFLKFPISSIIINVYTHTDLYHIIYKTSITAWNLQVRANLGQIILIWFFFGVASYTPNMRPVNH